MASQLGVVFCGPVVAGRGAGPVTGGHASEPSDRALIGGGGVRGGNPLPGRIVVGGRDIDTGDGAGMVAAGRPASGRALGCTALPGAERPGLR